MRVWDVATSASDAFFIVKLSPFLYLWALSVFMWRFHMFFSNPHAATRDSSSKYSPRFEIIANIKFFLRKDKKSYQNRTVG